MADCPAAFESGDHPVRIFIRFVCLDDSGCGLEEIVNLVRGQSKRPCQIGLNEVDIEPVGHLSTEQNWIWVGFRCGRICA